MIDSNQYLFIYFYFVVVVVVVVVVIVSKLFYLVTDRKESNCIIR